MKKKIVIASVLKPVDDVRSYWKLSQSIAKTNKYEVNIIGNGGKKRPNENNIHLHPHSIYRSNWIKRILIRPIILLKILKLRPDLIIITTHELINISLLSKFILQCKVVYDIQENHKLNLSVLSSSFIKRLTAHFVRWKETLSKYFIDQYWLAESCYESELNFVQEKFLILENKAFEFSFQRSKSSTLNILFTGTISNYGGIKRTLQLFEKIKESITDSTLTIIGQIHDSKLHEWLVEQQATNQGLILKTSTDTIPHPEILHAIEEANLGVIGYRPNTVNKNKVPTKLYEYSRYRLPYLVEKETKWSQIGQGLGGAIAIDFEEIDIDNLQEKLKNPSTLFPKQYPTDATWENESLKLITSLKSLIE